MHDQRDGYCVRHELKGHEVDAGVRTQERSEDHDEAGAQVDIDGFDVGDFWQLGVGWRHERRHGEHRRHAQRDPGRSSVAVDPERDPRDDDNQAGRDVDLNQIEAHRADELNVARQPGIIAWMRGGRNQSKMEFQMNFSCSPCHYSTRCSVVVA